MNSRKVLRPAACGRSRVVALLVVAVLPALTGPALAQSYPARPIRLVVGSSAGGGGDVIARIVSQAASTGLRQQIIVDNRPGAAGNIGADLVAKAPPDGYTLLLAYTGHAINPGLFSKLPFDPVKDFAPVIMLATNQALLVVHPSLPAKSVKELIALAKERPGKLSIGGLTGSSPQLAGELFKAMAGIDMISIPYKGNGPALNDLLGGQIDVMFNVLAIVQAHVKAGKLRALAVAGSKRSALVPELPTVSEAGLPGFSSTGWYGILAPARTPAAVVSKLNVAFADVLRSSGMRERLTGMGNEPVAGTPESFGAFIREEIPKWAKVIKAAGIKPE
jgi:tripartite-type tricarboxylate transporter receptor subunit TctC